VCDGNILIVDNLIRPDQYIGASIPLHQNTIDASHLRAAMAARYIKS
jgi:hypothetical protein